MRIEELETPALVVDLDILENNLKRVGDYARQHGFHLRPHTKTHKIPAIAKMQLASGATGITVAKVGEAEIMAEGGLDNILLAYPVFGVSKWDRLARIAKERKLTIAADSAITIQGISDSMNRLGARVDMLVEFDAGMRRCGVQSAAEVEQLALLIARLPGLRFAGVMYYPGHIWNPPEEQGPALTRVAEQLQEIKSTLGEHGLECEVTSGGSTPTLFQNHLVEGLTEIRPGTYVFYDRNEWGGGYCTLENCALRVLVTVISNAVPGRVMLDGGSKTFCADRWISGDQRGFGYICERPDAYFESMTEEHGHVNLPEGGSRPEVGERLSIVPNHVCGCVNMHDEIYYHRKGIVEGSWKVAARGRVR